jgi:hypothetical protein
MRQVNKAVKRLNYPLPTLEELLPELNDCKVFARLDILSAFHQIELHPDSRYITINVLFIDIKGLCLEYLRLLSFFRKF